MAHPQIQAHRGWSGRYPENTCLAYERALDLPIEGIELDVQLSADGVPVVIHDATVDRTTDGHGRVASFTARELARLNAAAHWPASTRPGSRPSNLMRQVPEQGLAFQPIPTLEQALTAIWRARQDTIVNIELKVYQANGRSLVDAVVPTARELAHRMSVPFQLVRFSSFRHTCLEYLKSRWPDVPTGLLYDHEVAQPWRRARRLGAESVNLQHLLIRPDTVAACHEAGVQVAAWTVNHPARIAEMYRWGVDVLISNHPDVAETVRRQWLKEDSTWPSS